MNNYRLKLVFTGLLFTVPLMLGSGCSTDADTKLEEGPVPFEVLRGVMSESQNVVSCKFNYENIEASDSTSNESLSGLELVIDSQTEFEAYISCDDTVKVNFEEEFVLAGMTTSQPTEVRIQEQTMELKNDSLYHRVGIVNTFLTRPSGAEYIAKVLSRDYLEYPVVFDIYWEEANFDF